MSTSLVVGADARGMAPAAIAYHLVLRPRVDRGIANVAPTLRRAARIMFARGARSGLLAFRVVDTHAHVLLACPRAEVGGLLQRLGSSLTQALPIPGGLGPARVQPIVDRRHLANALRYLFRQEEHHGVWLDPAHDGSSLPDLLGLRCMVVPPVARRIMALLPRLSEQEMAPWLGHEGWPQCSPEPSFLADSAAAALGLADLDGRAADQVRARAAAVRAATLLGEGQGATGSSELALSGRELAELLRTSVDTIERARVTTVEPRLAMAVLAQWRLRTHLASAAERRSEGGAPAVVTLPAHRPGGTALLSCRS